MPLKKVKKHHYKIVHNKSRLSRTTSSSSSTRIQRKYDANMIRDQMWYYILSKYFNSVNMSSPSTTTSTVSQMVIGEQVQPATSTTSATKQQSDNSLEKQSEQLPKTTDKPDNTTNSVSEPAKNINKTTREEEAGLTDFLKYINVGTETSSSSSSSNISPEISTKNTLSSASGDDNTSSTESETVLPNNYSEIFKLTKNKKNYLPLMNLIKRTMQETNAKDISQVTDDDDDDDEDDEESDNSDDEESENKEKPLRNSNVTTSPFQNANWQSIMQLMEKFSVMKELYARGETRKLF